MGPDTLNPGCSVGPNTLTPGQIRPLVDGNCSIDISGHPATSGWPRREATAEAQTDPQPLFEGVPMDWKRKWPGGFPVFVRETKGARFGHVDGIEYVDFCLGDTRADDGSRARADAEVS